MNSKILIISILIIAIALGAYLLIRYNEGETLIEDQMPLVNVPTEFSYSDEGNNFLVTANYIVVKEYFDAAQLAGNSQECGNDATVEYFDNLLADYSDKDAGTQYMFHYPDASQDPKSWVVTVIPNKIGYEDFDSFKNDFDLCFADGEAYPSMFSGDHLLFVSSCGSGYDDGSGLPNGCQEMRKIIEPTIIMK